MSRFVLVFLTIFSFNASIFADDSLEQLVRNVAAAKLNVFGEQLLEPEQAFEFSASVKNGNTLYVNWEIAPTYYLYREKIKLELVNSEGTKLNDYFVPNGLPKQDEAFGKVEIFSESLHFDVPLLREDHGKQTVKLRAYFQGCAERGVCYPPMSKDVMLDLPVAHELEALSETNVHATRVLNMPIIVLLLFSIWVLIWSIIIAKRVKNSLAK
ncbi:MAG: protein-disulfide reductase DsbD N-terminal domain-containing protein [Methylococcales bacterium]|nr:protein-disulfide reductase DsbD N-terminal domain-containing protein [Methylococcales bacterium]